MSGEDQDEKLGAVRDAAWALIAADIPPPCLPSVIANLDVIGRHVRIVRAAGVDPAGEAAEVIRA
jgi:hypothetical protein